MRAHRRIIRAAFRRQLRGENWMLVADVRGFPVGQLWVDLTHRVDTGLLWAFRVMPPFKGLGLGSALLQTAERMLLAQGFEEAEIGVEGENVDALRLYRRLGFRRVGTEVDSFETVDRLGRRKRHRQRVWVMRKRLVPSAEAGKAGLEAALGGALGAASAAERETTLDAG